MRSKKLTFLSLFLVMFAAATIVSAQQWKDAELDADVDLAADFAVGEQAKRAKTTVTLNKIVKAQDKMPKLGARDFMLCLDTNVKNVQTFVQAIVTMDQYSNFKLMGWSKSTCGNNAASGGAVADAPSVDGFTPNTKYKHVDIQDVGADLAAQNAAIQRSKKTKTTVEYKEILKAEDMERSLGTRDFRLCLAVEANGKQGEAQVLIGVDQYSNYKMTSWVDGKCNFPSADGFNVVSHNDAGMLLALDFAIKKHSEEKKIEHVLGVVRKAESKGKFAMTYRICFNVKEKGEVEIIEAVVTRDQYSNQKLVSWKHSDCGK